MRLQFDRTSSTLILLDKDGKEAGRFDAANNVDTHSRGPWPNGTFDFVTMRPPVEGDGPDSAYGDGPRFQFDVPNREGMEVHAGRATKADGLGRVGFRYCTFGCIRTVRSAIQAIAQLHGTDPLTTLTVA